MSLIYCSECGKEVSDKAPNCPNCGNPINIAPIQPQSQKAEKKPESILGNIAIVFSLFGCLAPVGFILALIDLCINDKSKRHQTSWGAIIVCILWGIMIYLT